MEESVEPRTEQQVLNNEDGGDHMDTAFSAFDGFNLEREGSEEPPLEPRFNYVRMDGSLAKKLTQKFLASAAAAHEKILAIGTQCGAIFVMDHQGFPVLRERESFQPHRCAVTRMGIDSTGSYVISCANDCRVVVTGIGTELLNCTVNVQSMPKAVVFSPTFAKKGCSPAFICAERSLVLYDKTLVKYKATQLYSGGERDGFISCCTWEGPYIAFTNDTGTRFYDKNEKRILTCVSPIHDVDRVRSSMSPPRHCWLPNGALAVGWADTIVVIFINEQKRGEVHREWHLPMFVSGLSYNFDDNRLWAELFIIGLKIEGEDFDDSMSMMSSSTTLTATDSSVVPIVQTCVISPVSLKEFDLNSNDTLDNIKVSKHITPNQIHMAGLPSCNTYFLVGPSDLILASPFGAKDRVRFRVKYKSWDDAWELAKANEEELEETDMNVTAIGRMSIEAFLKSDRPLAAAARLPKVCGEQSTEWEWAVGLFERYHFSTMLAKVLPTSNPQLQPECYEFVLKAALYNDSKLFKRLIQTWNPDLYRTGEMINQTQWRIKELALEQSKLGPKIALAEEKILYDALAHLHTYERKYEAALKIYLSSGDQQIFSIIDKHHLFDLVKDDITKLMAINSDRALRLLLDNEDSVSTTFVMDKIARQPRLQMAYLTKLLNRGEGAEFADKAVQLYAEYDRKKLLPFLRKNENYHLNRALNICKQKNYIEEMILLLAKGGNHFDAVNLMVRTYKDLDKAIDYCKDQEDPDLWLHLIDAISQTPEHFPKLLTQAAGSVDPLTIIEKMPLDTEIPGLRDSLQKVLVDYAAHVVLQHGCREAMLADNHVLLTALLTCNSNATYIHIRKHCALCGDLIASTPSKNMEIRVFRCGHVSHDNCCLEAERRHKGPVAGCLACSLKSRD